eukprot:899293-Amphidinium_carterae.1
MNSKDLNNSRRLQSVAQTPMFQQLGESFRNNIWIYLLHLSNCLGQRNCSNAWCQLVGMLVKGSSAMSFYSFWLCWGTFRGRWACATIGSPSESKDITRGLRERGVAQPQPSPVDA